MITLGINSFFEHPSIVLMKNGNVIFASEDERFTEIKHGKSYSPYSAHIPFDALYYGLEFCDLTTSDISHVSYSYSKWLHLRSLRGCFTGQRISSFREELSAFVTLTQVPQLLSSGYQLRRKYLGRINPKDFKSINFKEWPHHLCHAASAFYFSGWKDALVVVADGAGENACTSIYDGRNNKLTAITSMDLPNSLGHFYSYITQYLGFEPFSDEFKVMGLAAYGHGNYVDQLEKIITLEANGSYKVSLPLLQSLETILPAARNPDDEILQIQKDIARSAQIILEKVLLHVISFHLKRSGNRKICLAGGIFLNCVANGKIAELSQVDEVFVQPASSDAGTALGAAALSHLQYGGKIQDLRCDSMALGTSYSDNTIEAMLVARGLPTTKYQDSKLAEKLARKLTNNKVCAIFRGRMEFGPRALGMRSLLANPCSSETKNKLNQIKDRESFRPVAPIITAEAFDHYFEGYQNPYMLFTCKAKELAKETLPSAIHVDGSARVQTINNHDNPFLHDLLVKVGKYSGHPCVINTSFNIQGKPILESPLQAINCFLSSNIDVLVIGNYLLEKKD